MRTWGSAAAVIAALRDDAAAEIERLEREADAGLIRIRDAAARADEVPDPAPRLAAARRTAADLVTDEDWEDTMSAAADRDAWIASVVARGRRAVAEAPDALAWTAGLIDEAVRRLPVASCVVVVVPAALLPRMTDEWRTALEAAAGRTITLEAGGFAAGCLARTSDGKVTFDNRLEAREARTLTEWRAALASAYQSAVADAVAEPV